MFFNKNKKDIDNIKDLIKSFKEIQEKNKELESELKDLKKNFNKTIQGVGVVRFNPFPGVGGNQSFSLAILDGNKDGAIITSYYSREGSSVYAKEIKKGKSDHSLLKEELKAIFIADEKIKDEKRKNN